MVHLGAVATEAARLSTSYHRETQLSHYGNSHLSQCGRIEDHQTL